MLKQAVTDAQDQAKATLAEELARLEAEKQQRVGEEVEKMEQRLAELRALEENRARLLRSAIVEKERMLTERTAQPRNPLAILIQLKEGSRNSGCYTGCIQAPDSVCKALLDTIGKPIFLHFSPAFNTSG